MSGIAVAVISIRETDICLFKISWWNRHPWCAFSTFSDFLLSIHQLIPRLFKFAKFICCIWALFITFAIHHNLFEDYSWEWQTRVRSYPPDCLHPSTIIRIPSKVISGPFWPAESSRNNHLSVVLLLVARLARTSPKSEGKEFRPKFLHHLVKHQQPAIRTAWRIVCGPVWWAESPCAIHFTIALLVVELQVKTSPICKGEKFRPHFFTSCATAHNYHQNSVEGYFWTYLINPYHPFVHRSVGCWSTSKSGLPRC